MSTDAYCVRGKFPIIDQGASFVAGYTDCEDGLFTDVPVIVFGDHTRCFKYVDFPFFPGADGVKILKTRLEHADEKYLYFALKSLNIPNTGYNRHFKWLKAASISIPNQERQKEVAAVLESIMRIIKCYQSQLSKLDNLVKARFVEMFIGVDSQIPKWNRVSLSTLCSSIVRGPFGSALKKELFVSETSETRKVYEQKNAIDQSHTIGSYYISKEKFQELARFECGPGDFIMSCSGTIGKLYQLPSTAKKGVINQALCKFTLNDAILPEVFLEFMRYSVSTLETKGSGIQNIGAVSYIKNIPVPLAPKEVQLRFAQFVQEVDKSKVVVQKALAQAQLLYDSMVQQFFD